MKSGSMDASGRGGGQGRSPPANNNGREKRGDMECEGQEGELRSEVEGGSCVVSVAGQSSGGEVCGKLFPPIVSEAWVSR